MLIWTKTFSWDSPLLTLIYTLPLDNIVLMTLSTSQPLSKTLRLNKLLLLAHISYSLASVFLIILFFLFNNNNFIINFILLITFLFQVQGSEFFTCLFSIVLPQMQINVIVFYV